MYFITGIVVNAKRRNFRSKKPRCKPILGRCTRNFLNERRNNHAVFLTKTRNFLNKTRNFLPGEKCLFPLYINTSSRF